MADDLFKWLPLELHSSVLTFVYLEEIFRLRLVSKYWKDAIAFEVQRRLGNAKECSRRVHRQLYICGIRSSARVTIQMLDRPLALYLESIGESLSLDTIIDVMVCDISATNVRMDLIDHLLARVEKKDVFALFIKKIERSEAIDFWTIVGRIQAIQTKRIFSLLYHRECPLPDQICASSKITVILLVALYHDLPLAWKISLLIQRLYSTKHDRLHYFSDFEWSVLPDVIKNTSVSDGKKIRDKLVEEYLTVHLGFKHEVKKKALLECVFKWFGDERDIRWDLYDRMANSHREYSTFRRRKRPLISYIFNENNIGNANHHSSH